MKPGWVYYRFAERFPGEQPHKEMFLHSIFGDRPTQWDKNDYWKFLLNKSDNDIAYARKYYLWEFGENRLY